jgi:general secretion pathway protein I
MHARRGFTLIEVLVAIAILGLGLTAILAAQAGTFTSVAHARNISQATGLSRCKMSEVEADLTKNGFIANDVNETGPCCDHSDSIRMTCSWAIEKPKFPEQKFGEVNLDTKLDLGTDSGQQSALASIGSASKGQLALPQGGNVGDMAEALTAGGGDMAGTASSALMGIVYPEIQQIFEAGTRKITVTITWYEGNREYHTDLVQWVVNARAAGVTTEIGDGGELAPGSTGSSSGTSGTSSGGGPTPGGMGNPFAPKTGRTDK